MVDVQRCSCPRGLTGWGPPQALPDLGRACPTPLPWPRPALTSALCQRGGINTRLEVNYLMRGNMRLCSEEGSGGAGERPVPGLSLSRSWLAL